MNKNEGFGNSNKSNVPLTKEGKPFANKTREKAGMTARNKKIERVNESDRLLAELKKKYNIE